MGDGVDAGLTRRRKGVRREHGERNFFSYLYI
jgi:hypothetical protein